MELYGFILYALSIYYLYFTIQNDEDEESEDSNGEFTFIDSI